MKPAARTTQRSAAAIYRAYNDAENRRDFDAMARLLAPDMVVELNGRSALGSAAEDAYAMSALYAAYPDYRREIVAIVDAGVLATVRWRMIGEPAPEYRDRLGDLDTAGCSIVEVAGGRITRAWLYAPEGPIDAILALRRVTSHGEASGPAPSGRGPGAHRGLRPQLRPG